MRLLLAALACALATGLTFPAAAQSEALLECTTLGVTPAFREKLADAMLRESPDNDALFQQLVTVSDECAGRAGLAADKGEPYFTYSLSKLARDAFVARLGAVGISAATIDDAFEFGEGRRNPVISGDFDQVQIAALLAALGSDGLDVEKLPDASWEMIGAYTASSSLMWQARRKLQ